MPRRLLALTVGAVITLAACGSDDDAGDDPGDSDESIVSDRVTVPASSPARTDASELPPLGFDCIVDVETVGAVVGDDDLNVGATGGVVAQSDGANLAWSGCDFDTADGTEYSVSTLTDEAGEPDTSQFDQLAELAGTAGSGVASVETDVGDASFFDVDGRLVIRTGDDTLLIAVDGAVVEPDDQQLMIELARQLIVGPDPSFAARCSAVPDLLPAAWGQADGSGGGGGTQGDISYETCLVGLSAVDGADLSLSQATGTEWFDALATDDARSDRRPPVRVDGIGDAAFLYGFPPRLFVRAGDLAFVVEGRTADDEPVEQTELEALAVAVVDAQP